MPACRVPRIVANSSAWVEAVMPLCRVQGVVVQFREQAFRKSAILRAKSSPAAMSVPGISTCIHVLQHNISTTQMMDTMHNFLVVSFYRGEPTRASIPPSYRSSEVLKHHTRAPPSRLHSTGSHHQCRQYRHCVQYRHDAGCGHQRRPDRQRPSA